jgi:uncharacterized protein (DUF983 family)
MNPYETSRQESDARVEVPYRRGGKCPTCGSGNVGRDELSRTKPSVLYFIFFGWVALLLHAAFAKRADRCRDCGAVHRYKTPGSWIALAVLIFLVVGGAVVLMG